MGAGLVRIGRLSVHGGRRLTIWLRMIEVPMQLLLRWLTLRTQAWTLTLQQRMDEARGILVGPSQRNGLGADER